jgi:hypothetical protein
MSENFEQNEGLKILARIIAKAYLIEMQGDKEVRKTQKRAIENENISRTSRDSFDGKGNYQP